jgi:hydrogenase maturation factor
VAEEEKTDEILSGLSRNGVQASIIGEVTEPALGRNFVKKTGEKTELVRPVSDHLWTALAKPVKT